jgi:hypothetical protein
VCCGSGYTCSDLRFLHAIGVGGTTCVPRIIPDRSRESLRRPETAQRSLPNRAAGEILVSSSASTRRLRSDEASSLRRSDDANRRRRRILRPSTWLSIGQGWAGRTRTSNFRLKLLFPGRRRKWHCQSRITTYAAVAQLARASACHAEGRGFESLQPLVRKPRFGGVFCV